MEAADSAFRGGEGDGFGGTTGTGATAGSGGTGGPITPPEVENESYTAPAVSGQWIWTANPESGRVAVIDAVTTRITTANAGLAPTHLAPLRGNGDDQSGAVVINVGSQDLSVLRATAGVVTSAEIVPLGAPANRLSMSPSTRFAIAWSDASRVMPAPDPTEGMQDVTIVDLEASPPATRRLSVGYRPNRVFVSTDESHAYVVTEPSVSVIELGGEDTARVIRDVEVTSNPTEAASARDVTVTPNGALFFVRRNDSATVDVVSLDGGPQVSVTLPGVVTDLDLSSDGRSAFAVVRGAPASAPPTGGTTGDPGAAGAGEPGGEPGMGGEGGGGGGGPVESTVAVLPIPGILQATEFPMFPISGVVGSIDLAPAGDTAVLFTNATQSDRVVLFETETGRNRTVVLHAPVDAALLSPDGAHAVVLLKQAPGSTKPGGFALVPVKDRLPPKIIGTDAPPASVAISETRAFVTVTGKAPDGTNLPNGVYFARMPELSAELVRLASEPLAAALMPDAGKGFVAQSHPEGRITFLDLASGDARTITGFELGAKVVTGD